MIAFVYICVYVSSSFIQFVLGSCYPVAVNLNALNTMNVYIERNSMQVELIRFSKTYRLDSRCKLRSRYILSQPMCLRMESRSNIIPVTNYTFKIVFFVFVFKCLCSLQHVSRVSRTYCVQIVEICTFMNGGNFCDMSSLFNVGVRMESRSNMCMFDKRQFDSNLLFFTPFLTV